MPFQAIPQIIVEVGFGSNPLTQLSSQSWTDISAYVMSFNTQSGRQHELSRVEAGRATLTLNNADARFDPFNTSSPYNPNVVPAKRIRIRAVWNNVTYAVFCGFVESWGEQWPNPNAAFVTVKVVDAFKLLNLKALPAGTAYTAPVLADLPMAFYRVDETTGSGATDSSGNAYAGTFIGAPALGQPGAFGASSASVLFHGSSIDRLLAPAALGQLLDGAGTRPIPLGFELWFKTTAAATRLVTLDSGQAQLSLSGGTVSFTTFPASIWGNASVTSTVTWGATSNDGNWHYVLGTVAQSGASRVTSLSVDNGTAVTATAAGRPIWQAAPLTVGPYSNADGDVSIDEVAIYPSALSAARESVHFVGSQSWANDLSGARVGRILDLVGWPAADRTIEAGLTTFQAEPTPGNAMQNLTDCAKSENGLLFQAPDGTIQFFQRSHLWTAAVSVTSQTTFGDAPGEGPYILAGIQPIMDDLDLYNDVQATRTGGTLQEAQDSTSQTNYGIRTLSETNLKATSDNDSLSRAQYELSRYKNPLTRVRGFTITPLSDPVNLFPQVLGRGLWDRITFKRRPPGGGTLFNQGSVIEGIGHEYTPGLWKTTYALSPIDALANQYLVLDSATQGVLDTNVLAY